MQKEILLSNPAAIGEEIGQELGAKFVKDFQDNHPNETQAYFIGRNIIEQILAQPDCVGIRFYNALNEAGQKTLVYVGIDSKENIIKEITSINGFGKLETKPGITADRVVVGDDEVEWSWV
jgi:hypothetical protein